MTLNVSTRQYAGYPSILKDVWFQMPRLTATPQGWWQSSLPLSSTIDHIRAIKVMGMWSQAYSEALSPRVNCYCPGKVAALQRVGAKRVCPSVDTKRSQQDLNMPK